MIFLKKIFSLEILKIRKNWLWVQIFEIFRFFSISSQVLTMLCYSNFLETYFFGKFGHFYIWNGFSFIDQKTWSPKINFFKFFIFWKARHARVTRSRHTWSDQSDHPLLIPIHLSTVFHENGQKICIARLTWKYTYKFSEVRLDFSERKHKNAKMSIFWNFDKFSDVKIRTFFQKRDSSNFSSNSNSTVTNRLAYFFWDLLDTWKVKNCVSWNTLVIKNLCLSPQSLRQIENWSFFSWLRSLLKLRENLRK